MRGLTGPGEAAARLDRTLYVVVPGSKLAVDGGHVVVSTPDGARTEVPCDLVARVVLTGSVSVSGPARNSLLRAGTASVHVTGRGRLLGVTLPMGTGGGRVRRAQHRVTESGGVAVGRVLIGDKIANQRALLRRYGHPAAEELSEPLARVESCGDRDELMGVEGWAARRYFRALADLLPDAGFAGERTRPARDAVNAALNYAYTVLASEATVAAAAAGLDPGAGLLHEVRGQRPAMGLDIMEPFRAPVVDAMVVAAFRRRILRPEETTVLEDGSVRLGRKMVRALIGAYETRLLTPYSIGGERHTWRAWVHRRAHDLARCVVSGTALSSCRWR